MSRQRRIERAARATAVIRDGEAQSLPPPRMPSIVEFVSSDEYLGRLPLFPRQLTVLKTIFLAEDELTAFDCQVLSEWGEGFTLSGDPGAEAAYEGKRGTPPDLLDRMRTCRNEDRLWFRDIVMVLGRRGSKGYVGAICTAYVLWWYMTQPDARRRIQIDPNKTLSVVVFAGNESQAIDNAWTDIVKLIMAAPCFAPYRLEPTRGKLLLYSHEQIAAGSPPPRQQAAFEVIAAETTERAIRGRAAIAIILDEMGHMIAAGANRSADEIYQAATPALAQCGPNGMYAITYQASSPATMTGRFYTSYKESLQLDPTTHRAVAYDSAMFQLPSWELYEDFELTHGSDFLMAPSGPAFLPLATPIIAYDARLERERAANPELFDVEYGAQWATAQDHYLPADAVERVFGPWHGHVLPTVYRGAGLRVAYHAHGDPSSVNDRFAFAVAHTERDRDDQVHVVIDRFGGWDPADFPQHCIDYLAVERELCQLLDDFQTIETFSFDQHNSRHLIDGLTQHADQPRRPVRTRVFEQTATRQHNLESWEVTKRAILAGRVHAPPHEAARLELLFLRRVADRIEGQPFGPVTTDDFAVCIANLVWRLLKDDDGVHQRLAATRLTGALQGGIPPRAPATTPSQQSEAARQLARFPRTAASRFSHSEPRRYPGRGNGRPG